MRSFSAIAGALALAVIVIPVVVRTTEDMLGLVPNPLREAASALGLPRSLVIKRIAYRAARSGLITGVLLATPRGSPAKRRRCCSPRSLNQFLQPRSDQDDGQPAGDHQQLRAKPLRLLERTRLERGLAPHLDRTRVEYWRPLSRRRKGYKMTEASVSMPTPSVQVPAAPLPEAPAKVSVRNLNFYYGEHHALKTSTSRSATIA